MQPKRIWVSIFWDETRASMSNYDIMEVEIEEMAENYNYSGQLDLFSYYPLEIIRQWLWDVFAREPCEVIVDGVEY